MHKDEWEILPYTQEEIDEALIFFNQQEQNKNHPIRRKKNAANKRSGQKGGISLRDQHGSDHFAEIGRKGGKKTAEKPGHMSRIGKKGGDRRVQQGDLPEIGKKGVTSQKIAKNNK